MRTADRRAGSAGYRTLAATIALVACLLSACGAAAVTPSLAPSPTPSPTPLPTPLPHLTAPARADDVYLALRADGLTIVPNTASTGGAGHEPVKQIDATYDGWPLAIGQYSSAASLLAATHWAPGAIPGRGETAVEFIGLNILIRWGPIGSGLPAQKLTDRQLASAVALRDKLQLLLSPLASRTTVSLPVSAPVASSSAGPGSSTAASGPP